ncbi:hypothetical protein XENOCAPTIV_005632 [Xenoophorus captivus]|uniref:ATPase dynein-related AAA domain-containing protein n=1 Tax=Xenoophorus captivus TaxID=1517983 RepID=A0ABV0RHF8_9TELE
MTARDLLQQRYTLPNGDTAWRPSPLVIAAMEGKLLILDGIHRVNLGTLAVLSRLLHDRELDLYDGTRLLQWDRYQTLKEHLQFSDQQLQERVLALAEPPVVGASSSSSNRGQQQWLGPELLTMFLYHTVTPLAKAEEMGLIHGLKSPSPTALYRTLQILLGKHVTTHEGVLTIGKVSTPIYSPNQKMKVPDVLFYDNPQVIQQTTT